MDDLKHLQQEHTQTNSVPITTPGWEEELQRGGHVGMHPHISFAWKGIGIKMCGSRAALPIKLCFGRLGKPRVPCDVQEVDLVKHKGLVASIGTHTAWHSIVG